MPFLKLNQLICDISLFIIQLDNISVLLMIFIGHYYVLYPHKTTKYELLIRRLHTETNEQITLGPDK